MTDGKAKIKALLIEGGKTGKTKKILPKIIKIMLKEKITPEALIDISEEVKFEALSSPELFD